MAGPCRAHRHCHPAHPRHHGRRRRLLPLCGHQPCGHRPGPDSSGRPSRCGASRGSEASEGQPGLPRGCLTPPPTPPPIPGATTPPVRIESSSPSVTEGQTLDLNCVVAGLAHSQITWYKRGGSLPPHAQVRGSLSPVVGAPRGVVRHAPGGDALHEQGPPLFRSLCSPLWGSPGRSQAQRGQRPEPLPSSQTSVLTWPRCAAPGCACPRHHQPILENMCAEWRTIQAPRRPPSSSLSSTAAIQAPATPQVRSQRGWARAEPSGLPCIPEDGAPGSLRCYPHRKRRSWQAPIPSFPVRRDEGSEGGDRLT